MTEYLTIVYTINDPKAFEATRKSLIMSMMVNSDEKAFSITACSCDHEIRRVELIEEAIDTRNTDLLDDIISCRNVGNVNPALPAKVVISEDMTIFEDGNLYNLSSKATRLLIDSVIAEAISYVSGIKMMLVDEWDLLDIPSRKAYLTWLFAIADAGQIGTVLLFGTLKQLPSGLPEDLIKCYWLEDGVIADQDLKTEAEAA